MTKVIAISLFAAVVLAATLDADEPSTGTTLGEKTPNIANKHPDLHQALTDGTFDSMPFEQKIMFLHEPYFRDLVEFGLGADAVDTERAFVAEMAGKLANAVETVASVFTDDSFQKRIIEMHAAMFVANDRTIPFSDREASAQETIRERRQVMDLQGRMLEEHVRAAQVAEQAREKFDEAQTSSDNETYIQERFTHHRKTRAHTTARIARSVLWRLVHDTSAMSTFTQEDRDLLQSINDLDTETIGRQAIDPVMRELCALPANDVRGRVRLMNVAARAEQAALDLATTRLLNRLTADGSSRLDALLQSNNRERTSVELDWEGIATDSPETMDQVMAGVCDRYDLLVGIEEVLAKGRVALP
ncbi:MAG: hypothetical protein OXH68_11345 [Gammaproteobacteria bacterium]|nr:hypothetical protein [Gammaproteobacteria bacterium]